MEIGVKKELSTLASVGTVDQLFATSAPNMTIFFNTGCGFFLSSEGVGEWVNYSDALVVILKTYLKQEQTWEAFS